MNKKKWIMVFLLALSSCSPPPVIEGEVISSQEREQGISEHLVQTNSPHIPFFVLKTNKDNLQKGTKVILELQASSLINVNS